MPRRTLLAVAAVAAALTAAGCTPAPIATPSTTVPSSTSAAPSPTPTPSASPSPTPTKVPSFDPAPPSEAADVAAVRKGWQAYENALDKLRKDPTLTDFYELSVVTTGTEGARAANAIAKVRELGIKRTGDAIYRDVKIAAPAKNSAGVTVSVVSYCYDPAQVKVVYADSGKPYENSPTETFVSRVTMELLPDGSWRAANSADERKPC